MLDSANIIARATTAKLPAIYEQAKSALGECTRIDECAEWANKAEALASYARQSKDDQLEKMCIRIRGRAIRKCGELLKEFDARGGDQSKKDGNGHFAQAKGKAARSAGLSERQQKTAVRVANVPAGRFDDQIESDDPPSLTKLAEQGKRKRIDTAHLRGKDPEDFSAATRLQGTVREFAKFCAAEDWKIGIRGSHKPELARLTTQVTTIIAAMNNLKELLR